MSYVYYAQRGDLVKIGTSGDPWKRARNLQAKVLVVEPGGFAEECERHKQFADARVSGEWFWPITELVDWISELGAQMRHSRQWLLTPQQVGDLLGVGPTTVIGWAESGGLPAITLPSGKFRFRTRDIEDFVGHPELLPEPEDVV